MMPLPKSIPKGRNASKDFGRVYAKRYHVIKRLGSGNFGTVFLVRDSYDNDERWDIATPYNYRSLQTHSSSYP